MIFDRCQSFVQNPYACLSTSVKKFIFKIMKLERNRMKISSHIRYKNKIKRLEKYYFFVFAIFIHTVWSFTLSLSHTHSLTHSCSLISQILFLENIYATLPRTQRGQPIVLGGDPKGKNFLYCNGNSVIIRNIDVSIRAKCRVDIFHKIQIYEQNGTHFMIESRQMHRHQIFINIVVTFLESGHC